MESKEIKVYGTLVNETVGTVADSSHNDILMNAYQLYDSRFINNGGVNNYQDVINKRLTAITYANGVTTITGDLTVTGTTNTNNLGVTNNTTTKNLTVSDDASIKNITSSGNTTLQNVTVNGTTTANGTTTFNEDVTFNDNAQFKEDVTFGDNVTFNSNITFSQNTTISGVSLNNLSDVNTSGAADGNFLKFNGTNWVPASITLSNLSGGISFNDLTDVNTSGATNGSVLKYNGTSWVIGSDNAGNNGATNLNELSDVDTTGALNGSVLKYNGTTWVVGADNTGNNGATTLDGLNDVDTTGASTGSILKYNGTSWVVGTDNTGNNGATNLDGLSDVDTTGATNGSILKYNGSQWVVGTDIEGVTGATDLNGLSSVAVSSPQNGQVLYYDSTSSKWVNRKLSLSDITMPNASEGQVLKYTSGAWIAATDNTSSGGSGGVTLNQPLSAINSANLGAPSQSNVGLVWNGSAWTYQSLSSDGSSSGTQSGTITIGGVEAVDLGLSVKWATHNIGAVNLSDTGYGFEWGNKNPFTTPSPQKRFGTNINPQTGQPYDSDMSGEDTYNQSLNNGSSSTTYLSAIGKFSSENDMATQTLRNGWFTPTYEHFTELVRNTTVQVYYLQSENKWVLKFTARNGNYIIMPFCGKFWVNEVLEQQNFLYYSPQTLTTDTAPCINLETAFNQFYQPTDPYGLTYNSNNRNHVPSETLSQRKMILSWMDNAWELSFTPYDHANSTNYVGSTDYKYNIYPVRAVHL